jgi:hypothetical protein
MTIWWKVFLFFNFFSLTFFFNIVLLLFYFFKNLEKNIKKQAIIPQPLEIRIKMRKDKKNIVMISVVCDSGRK